MGISPDESGDRQHKRRVCTKTKQIKGKGVSARTIFHSRVPLSHMRIG